MKKTFFVALFALLTYVTIGFTSGIQWSNNFEEATAQAKTESKPLLVYFSGSDWCIYCQKLDSEVFDTQAFVEISQGKFIFFLADFPSKKKLPDEILVQNQKLRKQYNVNGFPSVLILSPNLEIIGWTGYTKEGPQDYFASLEKLVTAYEHLKSSMGNVESLSTSQLEELYSTAMQMGNEQAREKIFGIGFQRPDNAFFLLETYRELLNQGKFTSDETQKVREDVLKSDPENKKGVAYSVAVIDFQYMINVRSETASAKELVEPLVNYLNAFGANDSENAWRLEMLITQVYLKKGTIEEALKYAQMALKSAPADMQDEIQRAIDQMTYMSSHPKDPSLGPLP